MISQMMPAGTMPASRARSTAGFGLSGAHQHSAFAGAQREHVSGTSQVGRLGRGIDGDLNRARAVVSGDAGRDALSRVDRFAECRAVLRGVLGRHRADVQMLKPLLGHREADQATAKFRHEVDGFRSDFLGGKREVAFVLAVFVVDHHDHASGADFFDGIRDIGEWRLGAHNDAILAEVGMHSMSKW